LLHSFNFSSPSCASAFLTYTKNTNKGTIKWWWVFLEKLPVAQPLKNSATFYRTQRIVTVFPSTLHWPLSCGRSTQFTLPHPIAPRSNFIMSRSSYWSLSFWTLHQNPMYIPLLSHVCYTYRGTHVNEITKLSTPKWYSYLRHTRSIGLWRWYINIPITILDIIHRPVFHLKLNSTL
jgi:hypothetical protein